MEGDETSVRYPTIRSPFIPVVVDPDTVEFRCGPWAGPVYTIRDHDGDGTLGELVPLLDGDHSLSEVLAEFAPSQRDEVAGILERLVDEAIIVDRETTPAERAGGYLAWDELSGQATPEGLADAAVLVVNENLIGRTVIRDLTHVGVDSITLFSFEDNTDDATPVDQTGLEFGYCADENKLEENIERVDCVVYTEDKPYPERLDAINNIAFTARTPWIPGRVLGLDGIVGPTIRPGVTSCFECFRTRATGTLDGEATFRELGTPPRPAAPPIPKPGFARIIGGYLTLDVINLLTGNTAFTLARCVHFDFFSFSVEANTVLKAPRCAVCSNADTNHVDKQRFLTLAQLRGDDQE